MTKSRLGVTLTVIVLVLGMSVVLLVPSWRIVFLGLLYGESFYEGMPTSYWREQLAAESFTRYGPNAVEKPVLQQGGTAAVAVLIEIMKEGNKGEENFSSISLKAIQILSEVRPAPVTQLVEALHHKDANVRFGVAQVLWKLAPAGTEAIPALIEALKDRDSRVRYSAALALGQYGVEASGAAPTLREAANDGNGYVRVLSALALGKVGDRGAGIAALGKLLEDPDDLIGRAAAEGLGSIGPEAKETVPQLIRAAKKGTVYLSPAAYLALKKIAPEVVDAGQVPPLAVGLKAGGPEIAALIKFLDDPDERMATEAADFLGRFGREAKEAVPKLVKAVQSGSPKFSAAARAALKKIAPEVEPTEQSPK